MPFNDDLFEDYEDDFLSEFDLDDDISDDDLYINTEYENVDEEDENYDE